MARHHSAHLPLQPEIRLVVLALWAVAISTGTIDLMVESALFAPVDDGSVLLGAAENDGGDHLPVLGWHGAAEAAQVLGCEFAEDLVDGAHHPTSSMMRFMICAASSCPLLVRWR